MASLEAKILVLAIFLIVHFTAHYKQWYYSKPDIDMITHFFGGLAVSAFIKDLGVAIAILLGWKFWKCFW